MTVIDIDPLTDPRWTALLEHYSSDVFHAPAWMNVLTRTYGFNIRALVRLDGGGRPVAGLAYNRVNDIFPMRLVALSFSDYCDPLVRDADDWRALADAWLDGGCGATVRCRKATELGDDGRFHKAKEALWHAVDLAGDDETHWQTLPGSARRAIRKAAASGLTVRPAERHELRRFFELHLAVRKYKYRLVAQPFRFFEAIWDAFIATGDGQLLIATKDEEILGGVLYLRWEDRLYYKFNASDRRHLSTRLNDLLLWRGIQYGRAACCERLDLGLSDIDQPGLLRYKRKYATSERPITFWRADPVGDTDAVAAEVRGLLPHLTELFTDTAVPDHITERAGELLYRYFT